MSEIEACPDCYIKRYTKGAKHFSEPCVSKYLKRRCHVSNSWLLSYRVLANFYFVLFRALHIHWSLRRCEVIHSGQRKPFEMWRTKLIAASLANTTELGFLYRKCVCVTIRSNFIGFIITHHFVLNCRCFWCRKRFQAERKPQKVLTRRCRSCIFTSKKSGSSYNFAFRLY